MCIRVSLRLNKHEETHSSLNVSHACHTMCCFTYSLFYLTFSFFLVIEDQPVVQRMTNTEGDEENSASHEAGRSIESLGEILIFILFI